MIYSESLTTQMWKPDIGTKAFQKARILSVQDWVSQSLKLPGRLLLPTVRSRV